MDDSSRFQCSICMEVAYKPVATPCGHLYCWECIYNWIASNQDANKCPNCKAGISKESLIPIYIKEEEKAGQEDIPERPRGRWEEPQRNPGYSRFRGLRSGFSVSAGVGFFPGLSFHFAANPQNTQNDFMSKLMMIICFVIVLVILFH